MIPEYMRFYNCDLDTVLGMYTRTFFALVNSMQEIIARDKLDDIISIRAAESSDGDKIIESLKKQQKGLGAIVSEVKIAKQCRRRI